jgi:hypothetical protein
MNKGGRGVTSPLDGIVHSKGDPRTEQRRAEYRMH